MPAGGEPIDEIARLKSLLFSPEASRLSAAEDHIRGLEDWVGDPSRLEAATAKVLVEALRRAEVARHRELAAAVAPVVVAAIRSEIHNSRDMMVEALYPITGRLVSAAVANAFRELLDSINARLDALLSTARWRMRLRSIATGRPMAEIALSEASGPAIERVLLIERGAGKLIAAWRPDGRADDNPELLSGLIAAISEFAASVLAEGRGELRTLDLGASQVLLRASPRVVLAAEYAGPLSARDGQRLDAAFLQLVERHEAGDEAGRDELAALAAGLAPSQGAARGGSRRKLAIVGLVALAAVAALLWGPTTRWAKERDIRAAFARQLAAEPELAPYPLRLEVDGAAKVATIRGLADSRPAIAALLAAFAPAAAPYAARTEVAILARPAELDAARAEAAAETAKGRAALAALSARAAALESDLAGLKGEAATFAADLPAKLAALREDAAAQSRQAVAAERQAAAADLSAEGAALSRNLADASGGLKAGLAAASERIDALENEISGVRRDLGASRPLAALAADSAIFFGDRDAFVDPVAAAATLDALAGAAKGAGRRLRVVGYADESGAAAANQEVSRLRAMRAARELERRGVAPADLLVVGRGDADPIVDRGAHDAKRNRRVVFELLYPAEPAP